MLVKKLDQENVTTHSITEALSYAESSVATNNQQVALLIKMPKLDTRIFRKVRIYPIHHNQRQIHIMKHNFLMSDRDIYIVNSLNPIIFDIDDLMPEKSTCISNLLNGKPASCNFTINPPQEEVILINHQNLIVNYKGNFSLVTDCGITSRNLSGPFLISFENCEVSIDNKTYRSSIQHFEDSPLQIPLEGISVKNENLIINLSLEHLHELHLDTRKELDYIKLHTNSLQWPTITIFGGIAFPLTVIGIAIIFNLLSRRSAKLRIQHENPSKDVPMIMDARPIKTLTIADVISLEPYHLAGAS